MRREEFISTPHLLPGDHLLKIGTWGDQRLSPQAERNRKKRAKMSSKNRPLGASVIRKKGGDVVSALLNEMDCLASFLA